MIGETECESTIGVGPRLMSLVQGYGDLARPAQAADNAQLSARDHRLVHDDVRHGGCAAADE
jgi:hypothetical protein